MKPKTVLGRGLDSLLGEGAPDAKRVLEVEIHRLKPNPYQPRQRFEEAGLEDLARSISTHGIVQPIVARPANGSYEIVSGERRWRAGQRAGLHTVPVLVREVPDSRMLEYALVENLQREDLNPVEEARAFRRLVEDLGLTQEEAASRVGKERATVANSLRLLNLQQPALDALESGKITAGHAKAILSLKRREDQDRLLREVLSRGLSVREAERYRPRPGARGRRHDADTAAAATAMAECLGVRVEIRRRGRGGEVRISFLSEEDLDRIYRIMTGQESAP